jgi:hypothetical protein
MHLLATGGSLEQEVCIGSADRYGLPGRGAAEGKKGPCIGLQGVVEDTPTGLGLWSSDHGAVAAKLHFTEGNWNLNPAAARMW